MFKDGDLAKLIDSLARDEGPPILARAKVHRRSAPVRRQGSGEDAWGALQRLLVKPDRKLRAKS